MTNLTEFDHPEGLFSLMYPAAWQQIVPLSEMSCFAVATQDGRTFFEIGAFRGVPSNSPLVIFTDTLIRFLKEVHADLRVLSRSETYLGGAGKCLRTIVEYADPGLKFTTDYFVMGDGRLLLSADFKTLSSEYEKLSPTFEQIVGSINLARL